MTAPAENDSSSPYWDVYWYKAFPRGPLTAVGGGGLVGGAAGLEGGAGWGGVGDFLGVCD